MFFFFFSFFRMHPDRYTHLVQFGSWYYPSSDDVSCDRRCRPRPSSNIRNAHLSILSADQMNSCRFINIALHRYSGSSRVETGRVHFLLLTKIFIMSRPCVRELSSSHLLSKILFTLNKYI